MMETRDMTRVTGVDKTVVWGFPARSAVETFKDEKGAFVFLFTDYTTDETEIFYDRSAAERKARAV